MRAIVIVFAVTAVIGSAAQARQNRQAGAGDEAAVRAVVASYMDARAGADEAALVALFTEEADQLTSSGEWRRGRAAVVRGSMGSSKANSGARVVAIETVRLLAAGVAIADGKYSIAAGPDAAARNMATSFVMAKSGQGWRITAIRNMLPAS